MSRGWGWLAMGFLVGPGWLTGWLGWFGDLMATIFSQKKNGCNDEKVLEIEVEVIIRIYRFIVILSLGWAK